MNKYLLLRDNKESGPYTVEELASKGLKPYDLVWLDGKSAAWRYPSEVEDLKAFAPTVEEQPYDRFYKKKPVATTTVSVPNIPETPVSPVAPILSTQNIYVTLPAGAKRAVMVQHDTPAVTAVRPVEAAPISTAPVVKEEAEALPDLSLKFEQIREEKMRQAALIAANPAVKPVGAPVEATVVDTYEPAVYSQPVRVNRSSSLLMRGIVATCLLLGGVIIGLLISNGRQQAHQEAIEKLAQQIRENRTIEVVTPPPPVAEVISKQEPGLASNTTSDDVEKVAADLPVAQLQHKAAANQPKDNAAAGNKNGEVVSTGQQPVKIVQTVVTNKPAEQPYNRPDVEKARRNIHQMVSVDANKYKTGVLGGISDLQLTISNNSDFPLDQVEVEVRFLGPEKRVVKTQMMLFNDVAAGGAKTLEAPRTNRGISVDYSIVHINSKALGLASAGY